MGQLFEPPRSSGTVFFVAARAVAGLYALAARRFDSTKHIGIGTGALFHAFARTTGALLLGTRHRAGAP